MNIQIAIVSEQVLANVIPALMYRPEIIFLVCSDQMKQRKLDRRFIAALGEQGPEVIVKTGAPDSNMRLIHEYALNLAAEVEQTHPGAEITFNATGGTKLMSLGFVEVLRGCVARIIYTDTAHRCIEMLPDPRGVVVEPEPMSSVLKVPRYLAAQGLRYVSAVSDGAEWRAGTVSRKPACKYLGQNAINLHGFIGAINRLANLALENKPGTHIEALRWPRQSLNGPPRGIWSDAMKEIAKCGLVQWREGNAEFDFISTEATLFLRGGWLEEYAWHALADNGAHDTRLGVTVTGDDAPLRKNEFDVLACHANQLLFIECKTLRLHDENESDIAYKVDSLGQDARGLFGETWLLSARTPSNGLFDRAAQARIRVVGPEQLPKLRDLARKWITGGLPPPQYRNPAPQI